MIPILAVWFLRSQFLSGGNCLKLTCAPKNMCAVLAATVKEP